MNFPIKQRYPVLLVHGISDTQTVFKRIASYLRNHGWAVYALDLVPNNGAIALDKLAQQIADYIADKFEPNQPLDLVGFSMGGLVSRYYVQRLGGIDRIKRFVTISSPHKGTFLAFASNLPGCVQMRPNSAFLQDLNSDVQILKRLNFTSIWTPYDLMILPASSSSLSHLNIGKEITIPVALHSWMLKDSRILAALAETLTSF
jgi:triacylglycerol lipase